MLCAEAITDQLDSRKPFLSQWYCIKLSKDDASQLSVASMFAATTWLTGDLVMTGGSVHNRKMMHSSLDKYNLLQASLNKYYLSDN